MKLTMVNMELFPHGNKKIEKKIVVCFKFAVL